MRLHHAIKTKRPGKLSRGVILIHDNARPHKARIIESLLADFQWDIFGHPAHSPDFAPSDYHLFPGLHKWLGGRRFATDEEVKAAVHGYFTQLDENYYARGIAKLFDRYAKCIERFRS